MNEERMRWENTECVVYMTNHDPKLKDRNHVHMILENHTMIIMD